MTEARPLISLVVATIARRDELSRLLVSLTRQTQANFEVILVDQNAPGYLDAVVGPFVNRLTVKWLRCEPRGVSAARNVGIAAVSEEAQIIAFPDDDCWYEPDTLASVCEAFSQHPDVNAVMGQWHGAGQAFSDDLERTVGKHTVFKDSMTYNFFVRRTADEIPRFDEMLGPGNGTPYGCGEDTDYLIALLDRGDVIRRIPRVHVRHPDEFGAFCWKKIKAYARGRRHLLTKWKYAWWFRLFNIVHPLILLVRHPSQAKYRMQLFAARLLATVGTQWFHKNGVRPESVI